MDDGESLVILGGKHPDSSTTKSVNTNTQGPEKSTGPTLEERLAMTVEERLALHRSGWKPEGASDGTELTPEQEAALGASHDRRD